MRRITFPLALAWTLAAAGSGAAQAPWLGVDRTPRIAAELMKPGLDDSGDFHPGSSALYLSGRIRVSPTLAFVAELPVAFGGLRYDGGADALLGNAYVGVESGPVDAPVWVEAGGRLPLIGSDPNSAWLVGTNTDIDRLSAFQPKTATVSGALNVGRRNATGTGVRARLGPELYFRTSGDWQYSTEVLMNYGAQLYRVRGPLELYAHAGGLVVVSGEDRGGFGERSLHQLGFGGSYLVGGLRPGVVVRLPLDEDLQQSINYVIGLTLQVPLR